jgi:regulator of nucleoside diphosphate kinase
LSARPSSTLPPITVTTLDRMRLENLLATRVGLAYRIEARRLREELRRAALAAPESAPPTLVTMNSRVLFCEDETGTTREMTLVYPWSARLASALSILSGVGTALLGLRVGDRIRWNLDEWTTRTYRVLAVPYQPEAAGHWHL